MDGNSNMTKEMKSWKSRNWFVAGVIAFAIPAVVVLVSFDEVIERSVASAKVVDILVVEDPDDQGVVALVELTEGHTAHIGSIPQSVKIGDQLPIIVETHLNNKTTYRFDNNAWAQTE
jgi:hypothetical protein